MLVKTETSIFSLHSDLGRWTWRFYVFGLRKHPKRLHAVWFSVDNSVGLGWQICRSRREWKAVNPVQASSSEPPPPQGVPSFIPPTHSLKELSNSLGLTISCFLSSKRMHQRNPWWTVITFRHFKSTCKVKVLSEWLHANAEAQTMLNLKLTDQSVMLLAKLTQGMKWLFSTSRDYLPCPHRIPAWRESV